MLGLQNYFRLLLKQAINDENASKTLRYSLTFIWAKILGHDPSCRNDLISGKHHLHHHHIYHRTMTSNNNKK